jgi:hypothetical protein
MTFNVKAQDYWSWESVKDRVRNALYFMMTEAVLKQFTKAATTGRCFTASKHFYSLE